jgi:hypothetical protein
VEVTAGRYRDNRRGMLEVRPTATDMAEIIIHQASGIELPPTTTRIVMAGQHLVDVVSQLRTMADALESALEADAAAEGVA